VAVVEERAVTPPLPPPHTVNPKPLCQFIAGTVLPCPTPANKGHSSVLTAEGEALSLYVTQVQLLRTRKGTQTGRYW
jgi:hypothetical protein